MWLDLATSHRQTWLFSSTSTYRSTDLLTARGVAHLVVHGTSGSTSYEMTPSVRLETCGGVLSTVDMMVQRRDGPRWLRDDDDDDIEYRRLSNDRPLARVVNHMPNYSMLSVHGSFWTKNHVLALLGCGRDPPEEGQFWRAYLPAP